MDIKEAGYKYHMNDVTAALGLTGLEELDKVLAFRQKLQDRYDKLLGGFGGSPYLVHVKNRAKVISQLAKAGVEAGLMHRRNDVYTVFGGRRKDLPNMDRLESSYLFLPCHNHMTLKDVDLIGGIVQAFL